QHIRHDQGYGSGDGTRDGTRRQGCGARERQSRLGREWRYPGGPASAARRRDPARHPDHRHFHGQGQCAWNRAKSNVEGVVSDVGAKGQEAMDAVQEVGDKVVDAIDESLKTRPYTTLAIALGIGFLFGAMWRR